MKMQFLNRYGNEIKRTATRIYIAPHPLLSPVIAHYTISLESLEEKAEESAILNLVPDASGCVVYRLDEEKVAGQVYGATTKIVQVSNDGKSRFFIEFRPGGLVQFTRTDQQGLLDQLIPLEQINRPLERRIQEIILRYQEGPQGDADEMVREVDRTLLGFVPELVMPALVKSSTARLEAVHGMLSVGKLAELEYYSQRQINRYFQQYIGLNVKTFSRLLRVNHAVQQMEQHQLGQYRLAKLAQDTGFYDQPHFIRDFKLVCGTTPKQYQNRMSNFYNEPFKLSAKINLDK